MFNLIIINDSSALKNGGCPIEKCISISALYPHGVLPATNTLEGPKHMREFNCFTF